MTRPKSVQYGYSILSYFLNFHEYMPTVLQTFCQSHNAHLAIIESVEENNFVKAHIASKLDNGKMLLFHT